MDQDGYHPTAKVLADAKAAVALSLLGPSLWLAVGCLIALAMLLPGFKV
jgi:hypothetical protein